MKTNSPQRTARIAACVFIGIFLLGITTELIIRPGMLVPGDASTTVTQITASAALFRLSLVSDLLRQVLLIILMLLLCKLLKPVDQIISALMVISALVGVSISMVNELNHFAVLLLTSGGAGYLSAFETVQLHALTTLFLNLRTVGTYIAQLLSVWVLLLGYLVFKSRIVPAFLGVWLMLGGVCYTVAAILYFIIPSFNATAFGLFAFLGEAVFYLWLLLKGVRAHSLEGLQSREA